MEKLRRIIGKEQPLEEFHPNLRRFAGHLPEVTSYGSCLVTCSDGHLGMLRASFYHDVATPLVADEPNVRDRVFSVSNLCGRLEPGAFSLVDTHFTRVGSTGSKLLIMEIVSHVGRISDGSTSVYGEVERFGKRSPCCGALNLLLAAPEITSTVRHPWFEQLNAFFGPVRLASLRDMASSERMIAAAVVHAVMQAESALSDILQNPPTTPTEVLLVGGVAVNQQGTDGFLPVAVHHMRADDGVAGIVSGFSLRTTPEALEISTAGGRIDIERGDAMERAPRVQRHIADVEAVPVPKETVALFTDLAPDHRSELEKQLEAVRHQVESVQHDPATWRSCARPILRGLFRSLCHVQPELGVAAMLYQGGEKLFDARRIQQMVERGPATPEGRRVMHDIEAELQQLNHEDAQHVLEILLDARP